MVETNRIEDDGEMSSCRGLDCSSTDLVNAHIMPQGFAQTIRGDRPNVIVAKKREF